MDYPVIDPAATGARINSLRKAKGLSVLLDIPVNDIIVADSRGRSVS